MAHAARLGRLREGATAKEEEKERERVNDQASWHGGWMDGSKSGGVRAYLG